MFQGDQGQFQILPSQMELGDAHRHPQQLHRGTANVKNTISLQQSKPFMTAWRGTGGREPRGIGGRRGRRGGRKESGKQDSQGCGNQEKLRTFLQHNCIVFCNRNRKKAGDHYSGGWEPGVKGVEGKNFRAGLGRGMREE